MDNLSISTAQFKDMSVYALVTAGVRGNAVRMSKDEGRFYELGTINIIVLSNVKLSSRARARLIISATEAKTAALQDLDVRSTEHPLPWQATGTGTDEVIVVEGAGPVVDNAGGHCKLGELVAKAVYEGVREAVLKQNGIGVPRSVLQRLKERGLNPYDLLHRGFPQADPETVRRLLRKFEEIALNPRYAGFLESAMALSDAHQKGLITDKEAMILWARTVSEEIAEEPAAYWKEFLVDEDLPEMLRLALNAVFHGVERQIQQAGP